MQQLAQIEDAIPPPISVSRCGCRGDRRRTPKRPTLVALGGALVQVARGTADEGVAASRGVVRAVRARSEMAYALHVDRVVQFLRSEYRRTGSRCAAASLAGEDDEELRIGRRHRRDGTNRRRRLRVGGTAAALLGRRSRHRLDSSAAYRCACSAVPARPCDIETDRVVFDETLARGVRVTAFVPGRRRSARDRSHRRRVQAARMLRACVRRWSRSWRSVLGRAFRCAGSPGCRGRGRRDSRSRALARGSSALSAPTRHVSEDRGLRADALRRVGLEHGAESVPVRIDQLAPVAASRGMRELLLLATLYRARLGDPARSPSPARSLRKWTTCLANLLQEPIAALPSPNLPLPAD